MAAGATNCAVDARDTYFSAASDRGREGASNGGRLNDAKMVRQSLAANKLYVIGGTGRGDTVPKSFVNWLSLYRHRLRLALLVAANFAGPLVTVDAALPEVVDLNVSSMLAVMYVPLYSMKIKANGFDVRNL